mmetsp:Transcript_38991/g.116007  ORF Transcript_38991/g.116007 Transcript_38991/m.116007 type:complete len:80 (-) Transcript_38991:742-981(-)
MVPTWSIMRVTKTGFYLQPCVPFTTFLAGFTMVQPHLCQPHALLTLTISSGSISLQIFVSDACYEEDGAKTLTCLIPLL